MFPDNTNAKHQWNEPLFFKLRSSTKVGWCTRIGLFVGFYVLFVILMSMESDSANSPQHGTAAILFLPAMVAGIFLVMFELPNLQRIVTVTDKDVSCVGSLMMFAGPIHLLLGMGQWNRKEIKEIRLLRAGESENRFPHPLMIVSPKYAREKLVGIASSESLEALADHFRSIDIVVQLSGWQPATPELTEPIRI